MVGENLSLHYVALSIPFVHVTIKWWITVVRNCAFESKVDRKEMEGGTLSVFQGTQKFIHWGIHLPFLFYRVDNSWHRNEVTGTLFEMKIYSSRVCQLVRTMYLLKCDHSLATCSPFIGDINIVFKFIQCLQTWILEVYKDGKFLYTKSSLKMVVEQNLPQSRKGTFLLLVLVVWKINYRITMTTINILHIHWSTAKHMNGLHCLLFRSFANLIQVNFLTTGISRGKVNINIKFKTSETIKCKTAFCTVVWVVM